MRDILWAIDKLEDYIEKVRTRLKITEREEKRTQLRESMSESEFEDWEAYCEQLLPHINTYSLGEYEEELKSVLHALSNIDHHEKCEWVSEEKMEEIADEYSVEEYFSNNAAIIMECDNYKGRKVFFICLIKR